MYKNYFSGFKMNLCTRPATAAPKRGATMNTQSWLRAVPPERTAGPKERAGLTDVPVKQMPIMYVGSEGKGYARAALLVDVFADRIVLGRRDAMNDKWLGPDWVVPLPLLEKKPYDHAYRAAHDLAPAFPAGAKATVAERRGTDRAKNPVDQYVVSFPPAKSSGGRPRAYDYEVQATVFKGDVDCIVGTKRVYSPGIVKAEADEPEAVECVFAKDAITNNRDRLEFAVRPVNAFGRKGEAIKCSVA